MPAPVPLLRQPTVLLLSWKSFRGGGAQRRAVRPSGDKSCASSSHARCLIESVRALPFIVIAWHMARRIGKVARRRQMEQFYSSLQAERAVSQSREILLADELFAYAAGW
mmetsp:Transcript_35971/g.69508  ORF Transcript_35971/g.69508 Transcript_35971/m.69508 type:complete len:110 (-) Transcript_35971:197-526(-)